MRFIKIKIAWSAGDKIEEINKKLFLIANKFNLSDEKLLNCLKDQKVGGKNIK
jgi:hypothetical protein